MEQADSFDIWVFQTSLAYQDYHQKKEQAKQGNGAPPSPNIPVNTLQDMMDKVKRKQVDSKT